MRVTAAVARNSEIIRICMGKNDSDFNLKRRTCF